LPVRRQLDPCRNLLGDDFPRDVVLDRPPLRLVEGPLLALSVRSAMPLRLGVTADAGIRAGVGHDEVHRISSTTAGWARWSGRRASDRYTSSASSTSTTTSKRPNDGMRYAPA